MRRELVLGLAIVTMYFLAVHLIGTVLARYSRDLGIDIAGTSIMWASLALTSMCLRPLAGYIADRFGSFLVMSFGTLLLIPSTLLLIRASDLTQLIIARVVQGISSAFFISPSITAIAVVAGEYAGPALGLRSVLISAGGMAASPIAGYIADRYGYFYVFLLALAIGIIALCINVPLIERPRHGGKSTSRVQSIILCSWGDVLNLTIILLTIAALLRGSVFMAISGLVQMHYRDLGLGAIEYGYFYMVSGIGGVVTRYLGGRLSSKYDPLSIAIAGHIIMLAGVSLLPYMYLPPHSYLVASLYGLGVGLAVPTQQLVVLSSVRRDLRNRAVAIYATGFDAGRFIGPLLYGYIASTYGYTVSYHFMLLAPIGALLALIVIRVRGSYSTTIA